MINKMVGVNLSRFRVLGVSTEPKKIMKKWKPQEPLKKMEPPK